MRDARPPHPRSRIAAAQRLCLPHARDPQGAARARLGKSPRSPARRHGESAADEEEIDGLRFFRTPPAGSAVPVLGEWREIGAFARRIRKVAREFRPDLLHAHSPVLDAIAGRRVAKRLKLPLVYEIRAFWEDAAVGNGTGREGIVALQSHQGDGDARGAPRRCGGGDLRGAALRSRPARASIRGKIFVSPNGVDLTLFGAPVAHDAALAAEHGLEGAETIGFIGSFYGYEGLDDLIAAMPRLVASRPAMHLVLVGGGPAEAALRAQAQASPVADRIHFIGARSAWRGGALYSVIDVLVYPRKRMRLTDLVTPLKPLEAMAQRRLVAASDVGGHRELIRDGDTGTLFRPDDPEALARAVAGLFGDRDHWEARRSRARAFVEAERNWAVNVARYESVYQRLANKGAMKDSWPQEQ